MIPLFEKYRPKKFSDIRGQEVAIEKLRFFLNAFEKGVGKKKAILLYGPAGTGKTSLAHALANEKAYELFELNASDLRNRQKLEEVLKPSTMQKSLFSKGKILLIDEVDGVTATDYGGLAELIVLIEKTKFPVVITCNNVWQNKFSLLRNKCELVGLKELPYNVVLDLLNSVLRQENKLVREEVVREIAMKSLGDLRAALNDLHSVIYFDDPYYVQKEMDSREKNQDIFQALKKVFQLRANSDVLNIYDNVDMEIDQIRLWVEENVSLEYRGEELAKALEALSKSDIFRGRIHRQQYWHFLVYENFFLTAGIAAAKGTKNLSPKFTTYNPPKRILKIWMINKANSKKDSISSKFAELVHVGKKRIMKDFKIISLIMDDSTINSLNLSDVEKEYLAEKKQEMLKLMGL